MRTRTDILARMQQVLGDLPDASRRAALDLQVASSPWLKTEKAPVMTALADGKAVKIQTDAGTDYVFLSATTFTFDQDKVSFKGRAGAIRIRGKQMTLSLGEGGSIGALGKSLATEKAESKEVTLTD